MYKSLVALAFVATLGACAGTPRGTASAADACKMVVQDDSDSHIKVRRDCKSPTAEGAAAPVGQPQKTTGN